MCKACNFDETITELHNCSTIAVYFTDSRYRTSKSPTAFWVERAALSVLSERRGIMERRSPLWRKYGRYAPRSARAPLRSHALHQINGYLENVSCNTGSNPKVTWVSWLMAQDWITLVGLEPATLRLPYQVILNIVQYKFVIFYLTFRNKNK